MIVTDLRQGRQDGTTRKEGDLAYARAVGRAFRLGFPGELAQESHDFHLFRSSSQVNEAIANV